MDNKKIGKLIADLRRKQGLTQQDLGDKVGVGFRAVSKWERGITLPDISIINELSKILGISSDELLTGELKKENKTTNKKKLPKSIKITISIVTLIIIIVTSLFIYNNNKTHAYEIVSANEDEYIIEGQVTFQNKKISIIVNSLYFKDKSFSSTTIQNYEYNIYTNNKHIFGYGQQPDGRNVDEIITIEDFAESFQINYDGETYYRKEEIIENNITIIFRFIDTNNQEITKEVELMLISQKNVHS